MFLFLSLIMNLAHADKAGDDWLSRIDQAAHLEDAHMVLQVTTSDEHGSQASRTLEIWQQGDDRRLVRLTAPARLRGVGLLITDHDDIHLFLPQYPPARRVNAARRADAFMGTDFAIDDLSRMTWASRYQATVQGETDGLTSLRLIPNEDSGDASLQLQVDGQAVVRRIVAFNDKGQPTRQLSLDDVREEGGLLLAHHMIVEDLRHDRRTEATTSQVQVNSGISSEIFTVANLERP